MARISEGPKALAGGIGEDRFNTLRQDALSDTSWELADVLNDGKVRDLLTGVFDGSPYLSTLASRDHTRLARILIEPPELLFEDLTRTLHASMEDASDVASAKRILRQYKNAVALLTALADLGGVWPVMTVTRVLSECADAVVSASVRYLFRAANQKGQWLSQDQSTPESGTGYFVLAMGKHGAFELNYSSDIDLIVFFDRDKSQLRGGGDLQSFFVRLTRDLVLLLEERTPDGYVFRTDLRLRPDAGATQVALSTAAAHGYYETVGQNWERAAMIKARPCAGDLQSGAAFLSELSPFIWRKYLDFAAIADVHAMKRQIHAHKEIGGISVLGQNLKLGRGGIREIEFFAQTQQLIAGGRQPELRVQATLDALAALEHKGWVKAGIREDLDHAYRYLRRLEHRLQMVADEQTHDMPSDARVLDGFARFAGYEDGAALSVELTRVLETVERHYAGLFEDAPKLTQTQTDANMVFAGAVDDPHTLAELKRLGYSQPAQVLSIVRGWHHGRTPSVRSPRARERLTEVQPLLITALADTVDPDGAIASFDRFLSELPAGVQLFSLLKANPVLLRLLADIMGSAPRLARILSQRRRLLDAVLDPQALGSEINADAINEMLAREFSAVRASSAGDPMQDILDTARIIGGEQSFLVGIGLLTGTISTAEAGIAYATIAECLVGALLNEVTRDMESRHGRIKGGKAVVVAMGKLGGREMTAASDLDLIVIYDFDSDVQQSDGGRPLDPVLYYTRLTQRLINAISAPTAQGTLYEVDMRLRPSGQKGPVATRLSSYKSYHNDEAWTWEHMALTRARVIAGSPDLAAEVIAETQKILVRPRERAKIAQDVREMRARIESEKGTKDIWDFKQVRGGLVDLEFTTQHLQLVNAAEHPSILHQNTLQSLAAMARVGVLSAADYSALAAAGSLEQDLTQMLRLSLDNRFDPNSAPAGLKALLVKAGKVKSFEELELNLKQSLSQVLAAFDRLVV
jgi:glutamate-ammonia-ligase adenylyltransferase